MRCFIFLGYGGCLIFFKKILINFLFSDYCLKQLIWTSTYKTFFFLFICDIYSINESVVYLFIRSLN